MRGDSEEAVVKVAVKVILCCLLIVAAWVAVSPVDAHETDQFTSPLGREFAELGDDFTIWFYDALDGAVRKMNGEIRLRLDAGRSADDLYDPGYVAHTVNKQFPNAYDTIEGLERKVYTPAMAARYPGRIVATKTMMGQIYQESHFMLDPRRVFKIWFASTIKAYGVHMGTDKVGHFLDMGHKYYKEYRRALQGGASEDDARRSATELGTSDFIFSEAGLLGEASAGDYSNADLASNYAGLLFYINLTSPVKLKGVERPALLVRDGPYWRLGTHVRADSDFFGWFISDHFDEALNPGLFTGSMRGGLRKAIADRADNLLWRYRDANDSRRPAMGFDALAGQLKSYYGEPYGHKGGDGEIITLSEACFEPVPASAPPETCNRTGHNALHWAVELGDVRRVRSILERGFPVDAPMRPRAELAESERGNTALHLAAKLGRGDLIEILLAHGAGVGARNRRGATPLHMALTAETAARLLASGADANSSDYAGRTPVHQAAAVPSSSALTTLLQAGADPDCRDLNGVTPLHMALRSGSEAAALALIDRGANVNSADRLGTRPLHDAVRTRIVARLLEAGADPNTADALGITPLHVAAQVAAPGTVSALLEHKANPNARDLIGATPLHVAALHSREILVELLLNAGADARAVTANGRTPLHESAVTDNPATVGLLLAAGGDPGAKDRKGRTPPAIARQKGLVEIARLMTGGTTPESEAARFRSTTRPLESRRMIRP